MREQLVYNHSIPPKKEEGCQLWRCSSGSFDCSWLSYFHHTNLLRVDGRQPRLRFKAATHAAHTSLWERFECISTSAQPTEDKTEADKRQTPSACSLTDSDAYRRCHTNLPPFASVCVYYQYVSQYAHVRVTWRAYSTVHSYVTRTHEKSCPCFTGQCISLGLQPSK